MEKMLPRVVKLGKPLIQYPYSAVYRWFPLLYAQQGIKDEKSRLSVL
jgi:hypothetical protein